MRAALLALLVSLPAVSPARAAAPILGFNFPLWSRDGYASAASDRGLAEIRATGAGWVALTPTWYVKDRRDAGLARTADTPSDDSVRAAIRRAKALGLKVALKPHVDLLSGGARAWLSPSDRAAFFAAYRGMILGYAAMAREEGCELFVVGTELSLLTEPRDWKPWRSLIREVRATYPGPLTYAANWHSTIHVGFWRELDYIGVDAYYPVAGGTDRRLLALSWLPYEAELKALSAATGRPILFTEFGLASQKGANLKPWEWREFGPADADVQAAYLETFLRAFAGKSHVAGFLHWAWDPDASRAGPADKSMSVRGKPGLDVLERTFRASAGVPPLPAPPHGPAAARASAALSAGF